MDDERDGLDWWPVNHEHFIEASALAKRLDLTTSELNALVKWASAPGYAVETPMFDRERGGRN